MSGELGYGAAAALWMRTGREIFEARALGFQGLLAVGSLAYLLFASSPYLRLDPAPFQGAGLNPVLQDPALSIHPPMLYLGYVGYSFLFALAAAGLVEGRIDRVWAKEARRWGMAAFAPADAGHRAWVLLGVLRAWLGRLVVWDPVENASLMPWLIGAAFLHSVVMTEKRGGFAAWTALLAVLAFLFSIMGAFLVRSGVLTSVHAFAVDPERGLLLLGGLIVYGGFALGLFAVRAGKLESGPAWQAMSREGALMANNIVLMVATLTVLLGTLFPLMAEATGQTISVGEPYFNLTFVPMLALILILLPIVQAFSWGKADLKRWPWWLGGGLAIIAVFKLLGVGPWDITLGAAFGMALGLWLVIGSGLEIWRRAKTGARLLKLPARVWGMTLAHAGLGLFVLGAVVETTGRYEATLALPAGGAARWRGGHLRWMMYGRLRDRTGMRIGLC